MTYDNFSAFPFLIIFLHVKDFWSDIWYTASVFEFLRWYVKTTMELHV